MESLAVPVRSLAVKWQAVDDEAILVDAGSGFYFSLNAVGLFIWESCDGEQTIGDIHQAVVREFEVDDETAWQDLLAFLDEMVAEGLIALDRSRATPAS